MPPTCTCGQTLRPDFVLYGEPIPYEALSKSQEEARNCSHMLVIGTSSLIYPAAGLPNTAINNGAKIVEINPNETSLTPEACFVLKGQAGYILPYLVKSILSLINKNG